MKKIEIEVPEGKRAEWVNGVLTLVDEQPKNVMDRIKTFADAYNALGKEHVLVKDFDNSITVTHEHAAYLELCIIVAALNEGWKPTFVEGEYRWYPWFNNNDGCVVYEDAFFDCSSANSFYGSWLSLKSKELAVYAGKQFINIYKVFLFGW